MRTIQANAISPSIPARRLDWRIFLLALGMFALGTDAFVVAGILPVISRELRVTEGLAGQLVTVFSLIYGLGAPVFAALTGRWSRNRVLLAALGAFCLVNIGSALSPTFPLLLLTRLLAGIAAATYAPLAYTIGTTLAPAEKRGQALALVVLGLMVATVFGSPLGTWMGSHMSWRYSFGLVALLAGLAFLALLLGKLPQAGEAPPLSLKARLAPIGKPSLLLALTPALLWNLGIYVVYTYLAPLLHHSLMLNDVSGFLLAFGLGLVGGNWLAGFIADRFGTTWPLSLSLIALTIIYATFSFADANPVSALIVLFIWGALGSLAFLAQQRRLLDLAAEHANVILALNNSTLYLGIAGGAALGGAVLQFAPINALGEIGAAFVILALLTLLVSIRMHGQR